MTQLPRRVLLPLVVLTVGASALGAALAPYLAVHHPLWLLALNPWPRHMILVAPRVDFVAYMIIADVRAFLGCAVAYEVGTSYGERGVRALELQSPMLSRAFRSFERVFARAAHALLVVLPGPLTASLAAMRPMRRTIALPLLFVGETSWVYANHLIGTALAPWTSAILQFVQGYLWQATLASLVLVALYQWRSRGAAAALLRDDQDGEKKGT